MANNLRKLRIEAGWTLTDVAERMGVTPSQISRLETGTQQMSAARAVQFSKLYGGIPIEQILEIAPIESEPESPQRLPEGNAIPFKMEGASLARMREDLPIFGTALGASRIVEGEAIEQTTLNQGEIVAYAKRPVILEGNASAYGLHVVGGSMEPVHLDGDLIIADGKKPLRVGDDVVVYLRPELAIDDDGERARAVLVKRLVRRTASYIELQQFNPATTFKLDAADVVKMDRVLRLPDLIS